MASFSPCRKNNCYNYSTKFYSKDTKFLNLFHFWNDSLLSYHLPGDCWATFTATAKGSWGCLHWTVFSITYRVTFGMLRRENLIPQQQPFEVIENSPEGFMQNILNIPFEQNDLTDSFSKVMLLYASFKKLKILE